MKSKLLVHVTYHCKPGRARAFVQQVTERGLRDKILAEDGCLRYDYYLSCEDEDVVFLVEKWQTAEHQAVHMTQPHMKELLAIRDSEVLSSAIEKYSV